MFMQYVVSGISVGSLYALTALGLVLIYKTSDVVNFAQGEMAMLSTFVCFTFLNSYHLPFGVAALLALTFSILLGSGVEKVFMRNVRNAPILNQIILTLGLYMAIRGIAGMIWGYNPNRFPEVLSGSQITLAGILITPNQLFILGTTFVLMLLLFFTFKYTMVGLAMRAISQNIKTSELMGIKVNKIFSFTWIIGSVLGGIGGILIAPVTFLDPNMMGEVIIKAFAAAVLGGFTSLPGAVVGGLLIGVLENLFAGYVSAELKSVFVFSLIIFILYIRPNGLFGIKHVKKV